MNDFKEWLSDNLRYFILGFFVILVLVLAFWGIRFASARLGEPQENPVAKTEDSTSGPQQDESSEIVVTPAPTKQITNTNLLEKNAQPQVNAVIQKYYKALSMKDVEGIKDVVDELEQTEANKITNDQYLDGYSDVEVYTKNGVKEGEHVVIARYNYKFKDIDKLVPGLSQLYVRTRDDGSLYITMQEQDAQIQEHIAKTLVEPEVQDLINSVKDEYEKVQEEDEVLRDYIANLGVASSKAAAAENGSIVTIKNDCNVRDKADTSGEVVEQLKQGTEVTKIGTEGDWIQISLEGDRTGYVRGDLFE